MRKINNQIFEDTRFLSKHNLMDYSLLLIVETNPDWVKEHEKIVKAKKTIKEPKREMELSLSQSQNLGVSQFDQLNLPKDKNALEES